MKAVRGIAILLVLSVILPACSDGGGRNEMPVADAGADLTVMVGQSAVLNGGGSYDPEEKPLTYAWEIVQAPPGGQATLSTANAVVTELIPDVQGAWVVRLIVNDGNMDSQPDTVQVTATGGLPCENASDCDDSNVCTDDACDAQNVCQNTNNTAACDDADACTMNDVCANGACAGEPLDADGDGYVSDACTGGDDCDDSSDAVNPGVFEGPVGDAKCSDTLDNDCDGNADSADDGCIPCTQNSDCDDSDVCTGSETCVNNQCVPGTALDCVDGNDCTIDGCDPVNGCQNPAVTDGTECGTRTCSGQDLTREICASGQCTGSEVVQTCLSATTCLGAETCDVTDGCLAGTPATDGTGCDDGDGDWCNSSCQSGVCTTGTAATCDDLLECNGVETCDTSSGCLAGTVEPDGAPCDEGAGENSDLCDSSCQSGVCTAGTAAVCDDGEECTTDTCDTTNGCETALVTDGTECGTRSCSGQDWTREICATGLCTGSEVVQTCAGALVCSASETCDAQNGCVAGTGAPDGTPCDEGAGQNGNWCDSSCQSQGCTAATGPTCDDGLSCNGAETCDNASGCLAGTAAADGIACDEGTSADGDWCNSSCQTGACAEGTAPACDDSLLCSGTETCNAATGCVAGTAATDGTPCDEGAGGNSDLCDSSCLSGVCAAATAAVCDDALMCNGTETCDTATGCVAGTAATDGTPCDEGAGDNSDMCDSACQTGVCNVGTAVACDDTLMCNGTETCDAATGCVAGTPAADGTACDEGAGENSNPCDSSCQTAVCVDTTSADVGQVCADAFECTTDRCDGSGTCQPFEDDDFCDALNAGDLCRPGCYGGATGCGTPPLGMALQCLPNPVDLGTTDTSTCELNLAGVDGQAACLSCSAVMGGVRQLEYTPFDACDLNGWAMVQGTVCADSLTDCTIGTQDQDCCYNADPVTAQICVNVMGFLRTNRTTNCGGPVEEWRIQKIYNFSGLTGVEFCADLASHNADNSQAIAVTADGPDNPGVIPAEVLCQAGEPRQGVDDTFYRVCGMLPAWANGSSDVTLTVIAHSENNGQSMMLDNISIHAWSDTCTPSYLPALTEDFTGCSDPLTGASGWLVSGTVNCTAPAWGCFDDSERIWVEGATGSITRFIDTTALTGDVVLCFFYGDDGNNTQKSLDVEISTNSVDWLTVWSHSGDQDPDQSCQEVCVNLTDLDPLAAGNPTLWLSFDLYSGMDPVYLDHITITGAEACDSAGVVDLSVLTDNGDGTYTFTAQDTAGIPVDVTITCTWDSPPQGDEVEDTEALSFQ